MELRYIGNHQPKGMIVDIEDVRINELLDSGDYEYTTEPTSIKIKKKEVKKDDSIE